MKFVVIGNLKLLFNTEYQDWHYYSAGREVFIEFRQHLLNLRPINDVIARGVIVNMLYD